MNYTIKKKLDEPEEIYMRRKWFINEIKPKTKKEFEESVRLSNIWVNIIILGCIYPATIMKRIKLILSKSNYNKI